MRPQDRFDWERIIAYETMPMCDKAVAYALATFGYQDGTGIRPGMTRLLQASGASRASVFRALSRLKIRGFIRQVSRGDGRRNSEYELTLPEPVDNAPSLPVRPVSQGDRSQGEHPGVSGRAPRGLTVRSPAPSPPTPPPPPPPRPSPNQVLTTPSNPPDGSSGHSGPVEGTRAPASAPGTMQFLAGLPPDELTALAATLELCEQSADRTRKERERKC